jgi:hypothetical protein
MRRGELVVAWILTTVWVCIEAALRAMNGFMRPLTDAQLEALEAAAAAIGFPALQWWILGGVLWVAQGVLGLVLLLLGVVEGIRWFRRHPPATLQSDSSTASSPDPETRTP